MNSIRMPHNTALPDNTSPAFDNLDHLSPVLVEKTIHIREIHEMKKVTKQYLESSGMIEIHDEKGMVLNSAFVSGLDVVKDVTDMVRLVVNQGLMPITKIVLDTGKLNEYAEGDIECGSRKMLQITYTIDDNTFEERKEDVITHDQTYSRREYDDEDIIRGPFEQVDSSQVYKINKYLNR